MDRFDIMQLFVRVADTGSFTQAARALNISQPTASKQVAALEIRLGAQLFRRTTRGLSLTSAGSDFYDSSVQILSDLTVAESRIGRNQLLPSGQVRVAMSPGLSRMYVIPRLLELIKRFPEITIDFDISERHVNLIEDGIDVAVRIGQLSDSTLLARQIGSMEFATVASPEYLQTHGSPSTPDDLNNHAAIAYMFRGMQQPWELKDSTGTFFITPKAVIRSNDAEHIRAAVLAGIGIAHSPSWLFAADTSSKKVCRLLQNFAPRPSPIHAVWPGGRRLPDKVKVFIDFISNIFDETPELSLR